MSSLVIVGAQWGDEGKGKFVDYFTSGADWSVRFNGGNNAGHTIVHADRKTKLSLIPSGILREGCRCLIGAGVVVNGSVLQKEVEQLRSAGVAVDPSRLLIDRSAQLILPHHIALDQQREIAKGSAKIGTTGRGIGPAYEDRAARCGVRLADLQYPEDLKPRIEAIVDQSNRYLKHVTGVDFRLDVSEVFTEVERMAELLLPYMANGSRLIDEAMKRGDRIVFEGAQGTLLDPVFGTVPYVTSSHTIASSVGTGCGIGVHNLDYVLGIAKAYCTRVGSGPFPTELHDEIGQQLRDAGAEYGTVTGRPRRCGWFDAVALRYAVRVNGIDSIVLTKLDVLSDMPVVRVATGYRLDGKSLDDVPALSSEYDRVEVEYEEFEGWSGNLENVRRWEDLPSRARNYIEALQEMVGCPVSVVSVGAEREATLYNGDYPLLKSFQRTN